MLPAKKTAFVTELAVSGMDCQNCAGHVREALQSVPGVQQVDIRLEQSRATVRWLPTSTPDANLLIESVKRSGYEAQVIEADSSSSKSGQENSPGYAGWRLNVLLGLSAMLPLLAGEWVFGWAMERWFQWLGFALALPVQVFAGARFYRGAWRQLKQGRSNMDTLVALGSSTAFGYSVWGLFAGAYTHLYFMEAAGIIALISLGHWMEAMAGAKAADSLKALMNLAPNTARRIGEDGTETETSVALLNAGDRIVLRPGDLIPTDGAVLSGDSAVDESMLTGESLPIEKTPGMSLYAGTMNQSGRLIMTVQATGETTALAQIIAVVQRAQASRAQIQKLGDRVSAVFVPIVVCIAIGTGLWWGLGYQSASALHHWLGRFLWPSVLPDTALGAAFIHAASVLIIACPCAMGLATPAALMVGASAAARRGILIRDAEALEKSGRITAIVFDKTGTLTEGKLSVAGVVDFRDPSTNPPGLASLAGMLSSPSNHPLSQAVALWAIGKPILSGTAWREVRGAGVQIEFNGRLFRLGSLRWLKENGVDVQNAAPGIAKWSSEGATSVGLSEANQLLALFHLRDTLKAHARDVIASLEADLGKKVYLISGDNAQTAQEIARQAGIEPAHVFAEIRPEQKASIVKSLQDKGERVAFVGDGINDAPALEQADLGIAVSRASDVAREAADIILLKADLYAIPEALGLAQATLRTIKQNLFWAFFYNAAAIPLAAAGFLSPLLCAAAMGLSDLVVIGNALRLRAPATSRALSPIESSSYPRH